MKPSTPVGQALAKAFASQKATTQKTPQAVLREAETKAKAARQAAKPGVEPWRFAVDYRLDTKTPSAKGDHATRYSALISSIKELGPTPWHVATSMWEIHSHQTRDTVLAALTQPLDVKIDVLAITPIGITKTFGDPKKLKS